MDDKNIVELTDNDSHKLSEQTLEDEEQNINANNPNPSQDIGELKETPEEVKKLKSDEYEIVVCPKCKKPLRYYPFHNNFICLTDNIECRISH